MERLVAQRCDVARSGTQGRQVARRASDPFENILSGIAIAHPATWRSGEKRHEVRTNPLFPDEYVDEIVNHVHPAGRAVIALRFLRRKMEYQCRTERTRAGTTTNAVAKTLPPFVPA